MSLDAEGDESVLDLQRLWENCSLSVDQRATWAALDDKLEEATPPIGRRPSDDELANLVAAKDARDTFLATLTPEQQAEMAPIIELLCRQRKSERHRAEKREKKARKIAVKRAEENAWKEDAGDKENLPTAFEHVASIVSENPLHTPALEVEHVHRLYDSISEHWSHTRYKAWPKVEEFLKRLSPGSLLADLGCGNGKNIPAVMEAKGFAVASDMSEPLVRIAAEKHNAEGAVADCLCTNFRTGAFDAAISIAVLHHLSTVPRRVQALREGARILRPGGLFLVYCWSYEQDDEKSKSHHRFPSQDVLVPWSFRTPGIKKHRDKSGEVSSGGIGEALDASDEQPILVEGARATWQETPPVLQRYCHVYREGALSTDVVLVQAGSVRSDAAMSRQVDRIETWKCTYQRVDLARDDLQEELRGQCVIRDVQVLNMAVETNTIRDDAQDGFLPIERAAKEVKKKHPRFGK